jgi:hypothetical protein
MVQAAAVSAPLLATGKRGPTYLLSRDAVEAFPAKQAIPDAAADIFVRPICPVGTGSGISESGCNLLSDEGTS